MKQLTSCLTAIVVAVSVANMAFAQPSQGRSGQGQDQPQRGPEFRPPPNPLLQVLDANGDREITADEIKNAAAALAKLDKNGDGKLTFEELRPQFEDPGREASRQARLDSNPFDSEAFIALIMELDKNKDGTVSKDEIPERLQRVVYRADLNLDGAVDKQELERAAQRIREEERPVGSSRYGSGDRRSEE